MVMAVISVVNRQICTMNGINCFQRSSETNMYKPLLVTRTMINGWFRSKSERSATSEGSNN